MDLRSRAYEELDPAVEWRQVGDDQDVVEISLPGFRKEQVRVQVDNHGVLRATGERPPAARGGKWVRFKKDLRLPDNCNADAVRARFEDHKLTIVLPIVADHDAAASPSLSPQSQQRAPPPASNEPLPRPPPVKDTVVQPKPPPPRSSPPPQTVVQPTRPPPPAPAAAPEPTKPATDKPAPSSPPKPRWELPKITPSAQDAAGDGGITLPVPGAQGAAGGVPPPSLPYKPPSPPRKEVAAAIPDPKVSGRDIGASPPPVLAPPPSAKEKKDSEAQEAQKVAKVGAPPPAPPETDKTAAAREARELLVNMAAAVAVLIGITVSVWRTLSS
ncbi:hypothetical protein ABZP36_033419 [Zizania latifolia]